MIFSTDGVSSFFHRFVSLQVLRGHCRQDGLLADYCDGAMYKTHSLFSVGSEIPPLEIMAYYDDVEVCNPLGSRAKKHKLGMKCPLIKN